MTNKNLLKEAIADAKAVKETAIANAKLALEEAFTPHLKSMLSAKLQEMDADEDVKEEVELDEMDAVSFRRKNSPSHEMDADGGPVNPVPHKVGKSTVQEDEIDEEVNLDELLKELAEDARTDAEQEGYKDGFEDAKDDIEKELKDMKVSEGETSETEISEDARTDAEEEGYEDGMKDEKEDMEDDMEDEEIDLEDMSEDDLKSFIEDVISDMVSAGEIEPGEEFVEDEVEVEDVEDVEVEDDVDVDIEIDEAKKEEVDEEMKKSKKDDMDEEMSDPVMRHGEKGDDEIEKETEKMRFKEVMSEIEALKSELQEVNLLNAKLLYTNKIFKEKNLTENKKVKVLKAFDNAQTVREAKSIFETLNEGILDTPAINESIKKGSASKATGLEPKAEKQPIIESNDVYNRMRKLAGLI